jgi:hypothetical protein
MAFVEHGTQCPHEHQMYMVYDSVWRTEAGLNSDDVMCVDCLEERIGRTLTPKDFYYGGGAGERVDRARRSGLKPSRSAAAGECW